MAKVETPNSSVDCFVVRQSVCYTLGECNVRLAVVRVLFAF